MRTLPLVLVSVVFVMTLAGSAHADESASNANVRVHIDSPGPVELQRRASTNAAWEPACGTPCDRDLPLADEYRVLFGRDVAPGNPFRFHAAPDGTVSLKVYPAAAASQAKGTTLLIVGSVMAMLSLAGIFAGTSAASHCTDYCGLLEGIGKGLTVLSVGGLLAGGGVITSGAVSMLKDSAPYTTQRPVFVRDPTWTGPRGASTSKPGLFVPLSVSF